MLERESGCANTAISRHNMTRLSILGLPFSDYQIPPGGYDECRDAAGRVRPAWQDFVGHIDRGGIDQLRHYTEAIDAGVRESAIAFGFHDDQQDTARPWRLSTLPMLLDGKQWSTVAAGLAERTRVLEAVLDDLLGEQRLIKERVVPAELLWSNPFFHRAYFGLPKVDGQRLHITATDLARHTDGSWWVVGDRTRAPSGLGYVLQNRIVTGRVLSKVMRNLQVQRLARFFECLHQRLVELAPQRKDNPRIAILTPGETDHRYFEDAYLARYLGIDLVQGLDLAMRGQRLHLKTLEGLMPIETLWRHVSDAKCDSLELDSHSRSGVTGLLQAIRAGNVSVINTIGSILAQMPALRPFLRPAAKFLLGIDLQLPSIATYWCGTPTELSPVLGNLDGYLIRPAFHEGGALPLDPRQLSQQQRQQLIDRLRSQPTQFVAQHRPSRSTTPVYVDGTIQPWSVALRSFQLQTADAISVLPGAMVRLDPDPLVLERSHVSGRLGCDCWLVSETPVESNYSRLPSADEPLELQRSGHELTSRVAENLFWLGRYVERAEATARLLRTTIQRIAGENEPSQLPEVPRMFAALAAIGHLEPDYSIDGLFGSMPTPDERLPASLFDREQPFGLHSTIEAMAEKAAAVRDRISLDAYRIIDQVSHCVLSPNVNWVPENSRWLNETYGGFSLTIEILNRVTTGLLAFSGIAGESITRTHGWRFLQLGRRIERAYQTAELLAATIVYPVQHERPVLEAVLMTCDSLMTYRARYLALIQAGPVIDLLVTDDTNPRSMLFQLQDICHLINTLPDPIKTVTMGADEALALDLYHLVRRCNAYQLADKNPKQERLHLRKLLETLIEQLPELSNAITGRYLIHVGESTDLTGRVAAVPIATRIGSEPGDVG